MNKHLCYMAIQWLDEMSATGLHKTSSDLYEAIQLISLLRKKVKE